MYIKSGLASTVGQLLSEALEDVRSLQKSSEFEIDMWFLWREARNSYKGGRNAGAGVVKMDLVWATMYRRCGVDTSGFWLDNWKSNPEENAHLTRPLGALSALTHNDVCSAISIFYPGQQFKGPWGPILSGLFGNRLPLEEHLAILEKTRDFLLGKGL